MAPAGIRVAMMAAVLAAASGARAAEPNETPAGFKSFATQYYLVKTDVSDDMARETQLRVDRMFEEYATRTADFARPPREKFPLFIFSRKEDYLAAGGMPGSAGVFHGKVGRGGASGRLMAVAKEDRTWHVLQHEGFHQFAFTSISLDLPIWVNEGLAEYFGEGVFTGDALKTGLIPERRRQDVVAMIEEGSFTPLAQFVTMTDEAWSAKLKHGNYDQAWSMVHFLAQGDGGKYQKAFGAYMVALARGAAPDRAWAQQFGVANGDASFEAAWKKYWLGLPEKPTRTGFAEARAMILTSFLARAALSGKKYDTFAAFLEAAQKGQVKLATDQNRWLPLSLLTNAVDDPTLDAADFAVKWAGLVPTLTEKFGPATITVEYKNNRTVSSVKEPATKPATRAK